MRNIVKHTATVLAASVVFAASPAASESAWDGFYLGVQGGYQKGDIDLNRIFSAFPADPDDVQFGQFLPIEAASQSLDVEGFVGGGHVGYQATNGWFLYGIEADLEFADISDSTRIDILEVGSTSTFEPISDPIYSGNTLDIDIDQKFQSSLRGKVGWAGERVMVYATGGLAVAQFDYDLKLLVDGGEGERFDDSFSETALGYTIGAGAGYLLTKNISLGAEYRFTDYSFSNDIFGEIVDAQNNQGSPDFIASDQLDTDLSFHTVQAKLSYHF